MKLKIVSILLLAFLSFGGSASAVAVDAVKVADGVTNCPQLTQQIIKSVPAFDLTVLPGTTVMLSGGPSGTIPLASLWAVIEISVLHADQTTAFQRIDYRPASICTPQSMGATEISHLFKPGPNTVQVNVFSSSTDTQGFFRGMFQTFYFVATSGHIVSAQM